MKIIKKILVFLLAIVALVFIVGLFLPKEYTVTVATTVNKPQQEVFNFVKMLKNQEQYSTWILTDPNCKITYTGTDGTVGASSTWDSKDDNVGAGSQTITKMTSDRYDVDLNFTRPYESKQKAATFVKTIDANSCSLVEEFYGSDAYPMNIMSFIGKKIITDAFVENGKNVKEILEK
jgi:hypothetical protein